MSNPSHIFKNELSIYYQNVQGLIPFGQLGKGHPIFNDAKLIELHHYIESCVPDIVILNETWLKESINDNEISLLEVAAEFRGEIYTTPYITPYTTLYNTPYSIAYFLIFRIN